MAKDLYDHYRVVQEHFEEAANCLNENFVKLCFASSDAELGRMQNAYVALMLVGAATFQVLKEEGIEPDAVAGYNQGILTACHAAGGMSFPDGLYLRSKYAAIYSEELKSMDAQLACLTGLENGDVEALCDRARTDEGGPFVAIYYEDTVHYISGSNDAMARLRELVEQMPGVELSAAPPELGMHSSLMNGVYNVSKMYMEKVDCKILQIPLLCGTYVGIDTVSSCETVKACVAGHIKEPIYWTRIVRALEPYDLIIEIGPGTTLSKQLKQVYPDKKIVAVNERADIEVLKELVGTTTPQERDDG